MRITTLILAMFTLVLLTGTTTGCAVVMAAKQPKKKNLDVLAVGSPRALVIAELGAPIHTETKDGKKVDVFSFTQGYSTGAKAGRALAHGVADVFTLGLWEVVGTPTEAIFDGREMAFQVTYDESDKVEAALTLKHK